MLPDKVSEPPDIIQPADFTKSFLNNGHELPSTVITSPGQSEADRPGPKKLIDSVVETGRTEDVASSVSIAESDTLNLVENHFENHHHQALMKIEASASSSSHIHLCLQPFLGANDTKGLIESNQNNEGSEFLRPAELHEGGSTATMPSGKSVNPASKVLFAERCRDLMAPYDTTPTDCNDDDDDDDDDEIGHSREPSNFSPLLPSSPTEVLGDLHRMKPTGILGGNCQLRPPSKLLGYDGKRRPAALLAYDGKQGLAAEFHKDDGRLKSPNELLGYDGKKRSPANLLVHDDRKNCRTGLLGGNICACRKCRPPPGTWARIKKSRAINSDKTSSETTITPRIFQEETINENDVLGSPTADQNLSSPISEVPEQSKFTQGSLEIEHIIDRESMFEVRTPGTKNWPPWCMSKDQNFTMTPLITPFPKVEVFEYGRATLPWVLKKQSKNIHLSPPESPATKSIRATSPTHKLVEGSDECIRSLLNNESSSITEPNSPLRGHSPSNSDQSSTPSTITPLTYRMTVDVAMTEATGMTINTGIDGDDEKPPTFGRTKQISHKVVGSGNSKVTSKKDPLQTHESGFSGGDGYLRNFFRKKDGKAKDSMSKLAKGKTAEQDDRDVDFFNLFDIKVKELRKRNVIEISQENRHCKHPNHSRTWESRNLWCISHNRLCPRCQKSCCKVFSYERDLKKAEHRREMHLPENETIKKLLAEIKDWIPSGLDESTFMECTECHRLVCPECCSVCPHPFCGDRMCNDCNQNKPWALCSLHNE